jgi:hypothetical protein
MTQPLPPEIAADSEQIHVIAVSRQASITVEKRTDAALPVRLTVSIGGSGMMATMAREAAIELRSALTEVLSGNSIAPEEQEPSGE